MPITTMSRMLATDLLQGWAGISYLAKSVQVAHVAASQGQTSRPALRTQLLFPHATPRLHPHKLEMAATPSMPLPAYMRVT
jgi:predicted hotdog family 3-hydroxylacyl-ACP dehydratase